MIKHLFELLSETKQAINEIVAIKGKSPEDPLELIPPALRLYKKLSIYGLTEDEIEKVSDEVIKKAVKDRYNAHN